MLIFGISYISGCTGYIRQLDNPAYMSGDLMVRILDGNSKHGAHAGRKNLDIFVVKKMDL